MFIQICLVSGGQDILEGKFECKERKNVILRGNPNDGLADPSKIILKFPVKAD